MTEYEVWLLCEPSSLVFGSDPWAPEARCPAELPVPYCVTSLLPKLWLPQYKSVLKTWFSSSRTGLNSFLRFFCKHWRGQWSVFSEKLKKQSACYSKMDAAGSWHPFSWWSWPVTLGWLFLWFLRSLWFCVGEFEIIWAIKEIQQNELP